jgi:glycosyltransferase involved in cell wall biosynthesis
MALELQKAGIAVEVLTAMPNYPAGKTFPAYAGRWRAREEIDGIPVRRIWVYAGTGRSKLVRLLNYLSFTMTALLAALLGRRPDLLFVESQPLSLGLVALLMKWLRGVPYVYNVPDLQIDVAREMGFMQNGASLRVARSMEDVFLRHSWKVATVTHRFIEHIQSRGVAREQITFLPNGADTDFLRPLPPSRELLDRWGLDGKKVFLYVGTHAYYHGLDTVMEAADLLKDRRDIAILMIGDGPERSRLIRMAKDRGLDNVVFGHSPYREMDRLFSIAHASLAVLRNMDVARHMRLSKIFPSMACGVPVIYAGLGEAADLIEENGCGVVVAPEEPAQLRRAIADLAADSEARNRMGAAGRRLVEAEYNWGAIVGRWMKEIGYAAGEAPHA